MFIGNSFTFYNDFPEIFATLADSGGKSVYQESSTANGHTLLQHSDSGNRIGARTIDMISDSSLIWDFVVLQEQSRRPDIAFEDFEEDAKKLSNMIVETNATPTFFMPWGRSKGSGGLSFEDTNSIIETAHLEIAYENDGMLVPVGSVWGRLREENEPFSLKLWHRDGVHSSYIGSYLNACVFYAAFFNESPVGLWHEPRKIKAEDAETVQTFCSYVF